MEIQIHNVRSLDEQPDSDSDSSGSSLVIDEDSEPSLPNSPEKKSKRIEYPKPPFSYSLLAGLAFKNCSYGNVPVSSLYSFIIKHFPYFKNATSGWKNSIRHNLSMNKCFMRLAPDDMQDALKSKKGMLWALNPSKVRHMEEGIARAVAADRPGVLAAMRFPEDLQCVLAGKDYEGNVNYYDSFDDESEEGPPNGETKPERPFIFTRYEDGALPLVTLYSKTPALHAKYGNVYPVVL